MKLSIADVCLHRLDLRTRMPFRYGIATMTDVPHLFVEVVLGKDGTRGVAADHLPPKWFTKEPEKPVDEEIDEMLAVIRHAAESARGLGGETFFELWHRLYAIQDAWANAQGFAPLLAHFGTSLMERALLDAICRRENLPLREMIARDRLGLRLHELDPSLPDGAERSLLPASLPDRIILRHTVGLGDPLTDKDIPEDDRLDDGLPQSLVAAIATYRILHYKIKIQATPEASERLGRILACIEDNAPSNWQFSLDANESFQTPEEFRAYWEEAVSGAHLRRNLARLLFVEQPLHRASALADQADWKNWPDRPAMIIDESDGDLPAGARALDLGYDGISHKNCKGVIKGLLNRCRIAARARNSGARPLLMSGEDLANIGPVALPQDLAVQALLGNGSVERNGHHYFRGLSMFPEPLQRAAAEAHPDLYTWHPDGFVQLTAKGGILSARSSLDAPFGYAFNLDPATLAAPVDL